MASRNQSNNQHLNKASDNLNKNFLKAEILTYASKPNCISPKIARKVKEIEIALGQRGQSNETVGKIICIIYYVISFGCGVNIHLQHN